MKNLSIWLPPFAGDYSGVCSALFDFRCLIVLIDAACCTRNYVEYEEPRWTRDKKTTFSAELRTVEAVMGDDSRMIRQITETAKDMKPEFIAVLGSPVPTVVGMDIEGMAMEIEELSGLPCLGFNTTGFEHYDRGVTAALDKLIEKFGRPGERIKNGVNLLGLTPLDFGAAGNAGEICAGIEKLGFKTLFSGAMGTDMSQVEMAPRASFNVVVSYSGLRAARRLKGQCDIPYIAGVPLGTGGMGELAALMEKGLSGAALISPAEGTGNPILIVAEQVLGNSLRYFLRKKGCKRPICVAGFFRQDKALLQNGDVFLDGEETLIELLQEDRYTAVIGDPLLGLLPAMKGEKLFSLPHLAVSGSLNWKKVPRFAGDEMERFLQEVASL